MDILQFAFEWLNRGAYARLAARRSSACISCVVLQIFLASPFRLFRLSKDHQYTHGWGQIARRDVHSLETTFARRDEQRARKYIRFFCLIF